MVAIIADPDVERRLLAERRRLGLDRFDEVWDGVYFMSPAPNNEHQGLGGELTAIFIELVTRKRKGRVFPSCNISADVDWTQNYRIPDVAVFLKGNPARDMGTHWNGGPDLAVEILSPDDRSWEKLPFYAALGTREILLIDRDPWSLTVCRLGGKEIRPQAHSPPAAPFKRKRFLSHGNSLLTTDTRRSRFARSTERSNGWWRLAGMPGLKNWNERVRELNPASSSRYEHWFDTRIQWQQSQNSKII